MYFSTYLWVFLQMWSNLRNKSRFTSCLKIIASENGCRSFIYIKTHVINRIKNIQIVNVILLRPKHTRLRGLGICGAGSLARQQKVRNNERIEEGGNVGLGGDTATIYSFFYANCHCQDRSNSKDKATSHRHIHSHTNLSNQTLPPNMTSSHY